MKKAKQIFQRISEVVILTVLTKHKLNKILFKTNFNFRHANKTRGTFQQLFN